MRNDRNLLSRLQGKFDEVIVDEFQDINRLDFVFIETLSGRSRLVVVGDDDQAIYGFRGCKPDFIINLESHLRRPVVSYELSVNYRCPPNIVEHATKLINHNSSRVPKTPIANRKDRASIEVLSTVSADVEANVVVDFIRRVMQDNLNLKFNDFAILYRTNAQSLPLQVELISNNIPYYVRDKDRLQKNETLILMLGLFDLKRAVNTNRHPLPEDAVRTVCAYFRYMNLGEVGKLRKLFEQKNNFLEAINSEQFFRILPRASKSHLDLVVRDVLDATGLIETLEILQRRFKGLRGMVGSLEDVIAERTPLGEIFELAASFGDHIDTFVDTMNHIISSARASRAGEQKDTGVSLLTYFKAKGLQWHTVILTCCNEGLIPHRRANVEEERRLFYVGMTRASSNLLISYLENSCKNPVLPSRFIREAGLEVR
jgi:DNA helicase-2/ATP-dependent DNA helicase PcrA